MSTHVATPQAEPPPLPANAYCPTCGQVLPPLKVDEFPKAMYKKVPKPLSAKPEEDDELEVITVQNEDQQKEKEKAGYSPEVPKPKEAPKPKEPAEEPHEHEGAVAESMKHPAKEPEHRNKKS